FFFQAEDGIRDGHVTGVQTCALPISSGTGFTPHNSFDIQANQVRLAPGFLNGFQSICSMTQNCVPSNIARTDSEKLKKSSRAKTAKPCILGRQTISKSSRLCK